MVIGMVFDSKIMLNNGSSIKITLKFITVYSSVIGSIIAILVDTGSMVVVNNG